MPPIAIVLSIVLGIFLLLLWLPVSVSLQYTPQLKIKAHIGFLPFSLYPKKEKPKKPPQKEKKAGGKQPPPKAPQKNTGKRRSLSFKIKKITYILKKIHHRFPKCFLLTVKKFHVTVGAEDAAKTAILYGVVSQGVAYLFAFCRHSFRIKPKFDDSIAITPDFVNGKNSIAVDLRLSAHLGSLIFLLIHTFFAYLSAGKRTAPSQSIQNTDITRS